MGGVMPAKNPKITHETIRAGHIVKTARAISGYSQEKFGDIIGVDARTVRRWESGECDPGFAFAKAASIAIGSNLGEVYSEAIHDQH